MHPFLPQRPDDDMLAFPLVHMAMAAGGNRPHLTPTATNVPPAGSLCSSMTGMQRNAPVPSAVPGYRYVGFSSGAHGNGSRRERFPAARMPPGNRPLWLLLAVFCRGCPMCVSGAGYP